jgi:trk system potassium uptake protein TrkH
MTIRRFWEKILRHVETAAYLVAIWSFCVLFLEPIIGYYYDYQAVETGTAWVNVVLLLLTIVNRLVSTSQKKNPGLLGFDIMLLLVGGILLIYNPKFVIFFLLIRQSYFILEFLIFRAFEGRLYNILSSNPPISLMLSFALVIGLGTILLMLPAASTTKQVTPFVDALFTSTSATCVTGLVVRDTGTYFSTFGQVVILILIQIGGLGIMTLSTAFAIILGRRITLRMENVMYQMVSGTQRVNVLQLLKSIVVVTVIIEAIGMALLYSRFAGDYEPMRAFYMSIFHSVSAFCNAGFSLLSTSMVTYVDDITINLGITFLIILGGLGFTVLIDLNQYIFKKGKNRRLSLHTKLVLITTAVLILVGLVSFFLAEYNGSMRGFTIARRILSSWFQSVTTRTAGFNTIDFGLLGKAALLVTVVLMFIGASPGSTGGGIKTSTFAVLMLSVRSMLRGKKELTVFNRRIPQTNIQEGTSLVILALGLIFIILFILLLVEPFPFEKLLFEAVSAFGTVGLSTGITADLSSIGKFLITLLMYIGRIGPLTIIYALSIKRQTTNVQYAEENIAIG